MMASDFAALAPREQIDHVVTQALSRQTPLYVGIDPGVSGAIAVLSPQVQAVAVCDIPTTKVARGHNKGKRTEYLYNAILALFGALAGHSQHIRVMLEHGQPMGRNDTPLTAYSVGWGTGMWPLFLTAMDLAYELANPAVWKKAMGLAGKDKEASRVLAQRLFPGGRHALQFKKDHNRAEALLLAEYGRRRWQGQ